MTTSPARTVTVSGLATGCMIVSGAGIGITTTSPSADFDPFEIV